MTKSNLPASHTNPETFSMWNRIHTLYVVLLIWYFTWQSQAISLNILLLSAVRQLSKILNHQGIKWCIIYTVSWCRNDISSYVSISKASYGILNDTVCFYCKCVFFFFTDIHTVGTTFRIWEHSLLQYVLPLSYRRGSIPDKESGEKLRWVRA